MTTQNIIESWESGVEPYNATSRKTNLVGYCPKHNEIWRNVTKLAKTCSYRIEWHGIKQHETKRNTMNTQWRVIEEIDGAYIYPVTRNQTPDDWVFSRVRPVAKINEHAPAEIVSQFCRFINKTDKIMEKKHISRANHENRKHNQIIGSQ